MRKVEKIVLIGYMASGKSSLGEQLAISLEIDFFDLDNYIAKKEKLSITELFDQKGEKSFRKKEKKYLKKLLKKKESFVLAVGGGTPEIKNAMKIINKYSTSIYLNANVETLYNRLAPKEVERPILTHISEDFLQDYIKTHLENRKKYYEKASFEVVVDNLTIDEIVEQIVLKLQTNQK